MKKCLIFFTIFISFCCVFSKDRVNRPKRNFSAESMKMTEAKGWAYNQLKGEWVGHKNAISASTYTGEFKRLEGTPLMMSTATLNFTCMQFKKVRLDDKNYYVLITDAWAGEYKYPRIKADWNEYQLYYWSAFTEKDYNRLKSISCDKIVTIKSVASGSEYTSEYIPKDPDDVLIYKIERALKGRSDHNYISARITNKGLVRFIGPTQDSGGLEEFEENCYYETSFKEFSKLLSLN